MNKQDFLKELSARLSQFPEAERDKAYAFYAEIIDDSMEDGMGEEEAIERLGNMDEIIGRITAEVPMAALIKHKVRDKSRGTATILLLIFGFPIWFPILVSLGSVALVVFILFWIADLLFWVVFSSVAAVAVGCCIGFFLNPEFGIRLFFLGCVMACAGCAILLLPVSINITKQFAFITCRLWNKMKNIMLREGAIR